MAAESLLNGDAVYFTGMFATSPDELERYKERIRHALREMGIPESFAENRRQSHQLECGESDLVSIGLDYAKREQQMEKQAAASWQAMRESAEREGVALLVISAFRSFDYQRQIIARKLAAGQTVEQALSASALPGFSEHHTGKALDIGAPGCPPLTEAFEQTEAYRWLTERAAGFGFTLSYPRNNPHGIIFEPWHWLFGRP